MDEYKELARFPLSEMSFIFEWLYIDGQLYEMKTSWWRIMMADIWLKRSGSKFRQVGYDEFRWIVSEAHSADPLSRK